MPGINWNVLTQYADPGQAVQQGFQQGMQTGRSMKAQGALTALANDPKNQQARNALLASAPELAWKFEENEAKRADRVREQGVRNALAHLYTPTTTGGTNALAPAAPPMREETVTTIPDITTPTGSPLSPATAAPVTETRMVPTATAQLPAPSAANGGLNREAFGQLMALDPDTAIKVQKSFADMNEAQRKAAKESNGVLGSAAMHIQSFPPEQRAAELAKIAPRLYAAGITQEQLQSADLSDQGLQGMVALAMDVDKIFSQQNNDRSFAETQRHNRASEANAAGNLGVRQGALGLARQREGRVAAGKPTSSDNSDLQYLMD